MKGKTYNQEYSTQQGSHSDSMEKSKALRTAKAKRIQHQQTHFTTNTEGTSLGNKETINLKQLCIYTDCYIKTSWEWQTKKLPYTHTVPKVVSRSNHKKRRQEEKRPTKTNPKQENVNRNMHINNDLKCKWIKCSNQNIQTG